MYLDVVIALLLLLGFYYGVSKGIIKPVIALSSIIAGVFIANAMMPLGMAVIKQWMEINAQWLPFISFALLFIISILLIRGAGFLLESFIKLIYLNFINRCVGGFAFSSLLLLIMSIMISAGKHLELFTTKLEEESLLLEYVAMVFPWLYEQYPIIKEYFIGHL